MLWSAFLQYSQPAVSGTAAPTFGTGFELDVIAAVILGGVAFTGGEGSIIGVVLAVLLLGVINSGLISTGIDPHYAQVVKGAALVIAVTIDQLTQEQQERHRKKLALLERKRTPEFNDSSGCHSIRADCLRVKARQRNHLACQQWNRWLLESDWSILERIRMQSPNRSNPLPELRWLALPEPALHHSPQTCLPAPLRGEAFKADGEEIVRGVNFASLSAFKKLCPAFHPTKLKLMALPWAVQCKSIWRPIHAPPPGSRKERQPSR